MVNKTVIVTGAGFSVPAEIPIQSKIIAEMLKNPIEDFLSIQRESEKLLNSFVKIAFYLLKEFTNGNILNLEILYNTYNYLDILYNQNKKIVQDEILTKNVINTLSSISMPDIFIKEEKALGKIKSRSYALLVVLKEKLRQQLCEANVHIDLEVIFSIFDKALKEKENWLNYSYHELDMLHHSLLCLFTYYFGKRINLFSDFDIYKKFSDFVSVNSVSIITTNWDTIAEKVFRHYKIPYDFCLNDVYWLADKQVRPKSPFGKKLIKIHGSINWFRCLECGTLNIIEKSDIAKYLFDDNIKEHCIKCKKHANEKQLLLKPEIITPTMFKSVDGQLYRNLWKTAANELREATKIIFIGYSLPIADFELRYLLKKQISPNAKIDVVLIENDKPQNNSSNIIADRYTSLFPSNDIQFHYEGFQSYFDAYQ